MSEQDHVSAFRDTILASGIPIRDQIIADGELHRYHVEGDTRGSRNAWAVLHLDGKAAGVFGCNKRFGDQSFKWAAKGMKPLTAAEKREIQDKIKADQERRAAADAARRAAAAVKANEVWNAAVTLDGGHPYLMRKGVPGDGLRVGDWTKEWVDPETGEVHETTVPNALLVPILRKKGVIVSLQAIFPDSRNALNRSKDFLPGGEKRGCFFTIGKPGPVDGKIVVVVCEGFATGASINLATGLGVVVAFDAGNLKPVAEKLRASMPGAVIMIAADNDQWTTKPIKNPGLTRAREAATAVSGLVVAPTFTDTSSQPTDFNDLGAAEGLEVVKTQIMAALAGPVETAAPADQKTAPKKKPATDPVTVPEKPGIDLDSVHDTEGYFTVLGHDREHIFIYQHEMKMIVSKTMGENTLKSAMLSFATAHWWESEFPGAKGADKEAAVNWLLRTAFRKGFFDPSIRRGRGAWIDDGRIVYHFGNALSVDGTMMPVTDIKSKSVYEQGRHLPLPSVEAMSDAEGRDLFAITKMFRWVKPSSAILCAGWVALAPIGGALRWRPHIWINGAAGSGKTTVLNEFCAVLCNGTALFAQGNSTEAGIRQRLQSDSLPVIFDESEQQSDREVSRVQNVITMVRQSSTESDAKVFKGTTGGEGIDYCPRSMWCMGSTQVKLDHDADRDRIALLGLLSRNDPADSRDPGETWAALRDKLHGIKSDPDVAGRLFRRTIDLLPITIKNIETFIRVAAKKFGSQRDGDQYGTLMAGAWSLVSSNLATEQDVEKMIDGYDWKEYVEHTETDGSSKGLATLLGCMIRSPRGEMPTVYELVCRSIGHEVDGLDVSVPQAEALLRRYGMAVLPEDGVFLVSNSSVALTQLLAGTAFSADIRGVLLQGVARKYERLVSFNGQKSRCVAVPLSKIVEDELALAPDRAADTVAYDASLDERPF